MRKWMTTALLVLLATNAVAQDAQERKAPVHIGLVYPLSTNGASAQHVSNGFSLHAVVGVSREERVAAFAGVSNIVLQNANGALMAGLANYVGGSARGLQAAGALNMVKTPSSGAALSGAVNVTGAYTGYQAAGAVNVATASVTAWQAAGFANVVKGEVRGAQWAGFANVAGQVRGVQGAGFANVAGDVAGSQVAGFLNVAKRVNGVQLSGFINVAEESDYPIGLVNIVKNGDRHIGVFVDEMLSSTVTFRSGGRVLYGLLGAGYNFDPDSGEELYAFEGGLGAHFEVHPSLRMNIELVHSTLEEFEKGMFMKSTLRLLPELYIGDNLRILAGPSFNYTQSDADWGKSLMRASVWRHDYRDTRHAMHFGWLAGVSWGW